MATGNALWLKAPSIVRSACLTPGIVIVPCAWAAKQALSARICRVLDAVFIVVQPIVLCLSVGRFSAAFGSWEFLLKGRAGLICPDSRLKNFQKSNEEAICLRGDSGRPSCYFPRIRDTGAAAPTLPIEGRVRS